MRLPSRRVRTRRARSSCCRCWEVLATLCPISTAISSTGRSPWASTSTISARRPLASALAALASPSNSALFAARSPIPGTPRSGQLFKKIIDNLSTVTHYSSVHLSSLGGGKGHASGCASGPMSGPLVVPVVDEGLGNSTYLLDLGGGRGLVVDPSRDLRAVRAAADRA